MARPQVAAALHGPGVDGRNPISSWTFRDLAALISPVILGDFCGQAADVHMQDLTWVGPRACRHEAVVEQAMRLSPVFPARFGTLFSSLESLEKCLRKHYVAIDRFLDRVADKEEWAVKGMLDRKRAREQISSAILSRQKRDLSPLSPGRRYLQGQRMLAGVEKELNGRLTGICAAVMGDLGRQAADCRRRPVLSASAGTEDREMVWNYALLVPRSAAAELRARINQVNAKYAEQGFLFELSGPWPPYSFCSSLSLTPRA